MKKKVHTYQVLPYIICCLLLRGKVLNDYKRLLSLILTTLSSLQQEIIGFSGILFLPFDLVMKSRTNLANNVRADIS